MTKPSTKPGVARAVLSSLAVLGLGVTCACSSAASASQSSSELNVCEATTSVPMSVQSSCSLASATYEAGMAQKGTSGALTFELVSVTGGSISQGIDSWTIKITDANCSPVDGATVTIKAWMPQHNHGWLAATSTGEGGGVYDIGNLDIFMDGFWQITFTATASVALDGGAATSVTDSTVFSFCVND
jgi:hypothetical protein